MAPTDKKRKSGPTNESFARSRKTQDGDDRPKKRLRPEEKGGGKSATPKVPVVPKITRVREEEVAFPRGGASVLTPLEHKQIQIEATRDALFEQGAKSSKAKEDGGDVETVTWTKKKPKSKGKNKRGTENAEPEEESVKIEGLNYKVCSSIAHLHWNSG
jgi:rRNA biogenesis protein RRP5